MQIPMPIAVDLEHEKKKLRNLENMLALAECCHLLLAFFFIMILGSIYVSASSSFSEEKTFFEVGFFVFLILVVVLFVSLFLLAAISIKKILTQRGLIRNKPEYLRWSAYSYLFICWLMLIQLYFKIAETKGFHGIKQKETHFMFYVIWLCFFCLFLSLAKTLFQFIVKINVFNKGEKYAPFRKEIHSFLDELFYQ